MLSKKDKEKHYEVIMVIDLLTDQLDSVTVAQAMRRQVVLPKNTPRKETFPLWRNDWKKYVKRKMIF